MPQATLSIGSNIEPRYEYLMQAIDLLKICNGISVTKISKIYETPPWGELNQGAFLNLCCLIETTLSPHDLLSAVQAIETECGRVRLKKWGERTLDIDIITFDSLQMHTGLLTLPHPLATQRGFVMIPLNDIAPDLLINNKPVCDWVTDFTGEQIRFFRTCG